MTHKAWRLDHDPDARPVGCNGKYGPSGRKRHGRRKELPCDKCRASDAHYAREMRRGQNLPRHINPCGTPAAARRHRYKGERLDIACATAEADYHAGHRAKQRQAREAALKKLHAEGERLTLAIVSRRRRRCMRWKQHTHDHCPRCGVHAPAARMQTPTEAVPNGAASTMSRKPQEAP